MTRLFSTIFIMTRLAEKHGPHFDHRDVLPAPASVRGRRKGAGLLHLILIALLAVPLLWQYGSATWERLLFVLGARGNGKVNVIMMISDGYGPASETFGRSFYQAVHNNTSPSVRYKTPLDRILIGSHRSRSSDSLITDSAAGATAFSCGVKSYNGAIGVDSNGGLCGTVLEGAKEKGWLTGVVVTSRLSDATPASYFAHVASRAQESDIANEALGLTANGTTYRDAPLDLAIGGGGCYFLPRSSPYSCRADEQDLVRLSIERGWNTKILFSQHDRGDGSAGLDTEPFHAAEDNSSLPVAAADTKALGSFMSRDDELPLLALLAPFNTPYEIDRPDTVPALHSLAMKALNTLDNAPTNKKGFFLMIEGSQIDLCAHSNDPACHAREIGAYQKAIDSVTAWVEKKNKMGEKTILISTSDHETGGLALGRQLTAAYPNYAYYPERLIPVKQSAASLSAHLLAFARTVPPPSPEAVEHFVREETLGERGAAFVPENGGGPRPEEVKAVLECIPQTPPSNMTPPPINTADICRATIAEMISRRVEVGWSTSGHTGVDVPVHGVGPGIKSLGGNIENTEVSSLRDSPGTTLMFAVLCRLAHL